jgi:Leucine-rich repeat (LRR) protein
MIEIKEYNLVDYTLEDYFIDNNYSLEEQKELTFLSCRNNKLTSLEGIENCTKLKELYCSTNQLTSLNEINKCINLKYLYCDNIIDITQYKDKIDYITIYLYN